MALPEHLKPKTYWEERAALMEEGLFMLVQALARNSAPMAAQEMSDVLREWDRLIGELNTRYPAPAAGVKASAEAHYFGGSATNSAEVIAHLRASCPACNGSGTGGSWQGGEHDGGQSASWVEHECAYCDGSGIAGVDASRGAGNKNVTEGRDG